MDFEFFIYHRDTSVFLDGCLTTEDYLSVFDVGCDLTGHN